jgi:hypothetical protein
MRNSTLMQKQYGPMKPASRNQGKSEQMKIALSLLLIAVLVAPSMVTAGEKKQRWTDGFYLGAGVGGGRINADIEKLGLGLPAPPAGTGETIESHTYSNTALTYKFFGGYKFIDYFAIEGGFIKFNNSDERYCFIDDLTGECSNARFITPADDPPNMDTSVVSSTQWEVSIPIEGWDFFGVGILPISDRFEFFGKVGVISWNMTGSSGRERVVGNLIQTQGFPSFNPNQQAFPRGNGQVWIGPGQRNTEVDGIDLAYGLGFNFNSENNITIRTEFEAFDIPNTDDVWFLSLSAVYQFDSRKWARMEAK